MLWVPDQSRDFPVARGKDHGEEIVPLQHMEDSSGLEIHLVAHGGSLTGAGGCALKEAAACENACWNRFSPH